MKLIKFFALILGVTLLLTGCFPDIADGDIDLDTTYFPFGLGYEWCYERHTWQYVSDPMWETWDRYQVFTVKVVDSFWINDTLCFQLEGNFYGLENPVKIWKDTLGILGEFISVVPEPFEKETDEPWGYGTYTAQYRGDTLDMSIRGEDPYGEGLESRGCSRLRQVGAIRQGRHYNGWSVGVNWDDGLRDKLLWFFDGCDTVYKSVDWGKDVGIDLDTTYFPFGLGYEWTYQRHRFGWKLNENEDTVSIEEYDTFTVNVSDSIFQNQTVLFQLNDSEKPFYDLGNPVTFFNGKVLLVLFKSLTQLWASPYSPATNEHISYIGDTLRVYETDEWADWKKYEWTKRIRGLGVVLQATWFDQYYDSVTTIIDSLIGFTTPEGQVYP